MKAIGFDFTRRRMDVSHHPFCGGVPSDVRMTTRYTTSEFLSSLMGILHETGHGLYEQGLPKEWAHWPAGRPAAWRPMKAKACLSKSSWPATPPSGNGPCPWCVNSLGDVAIVGWSLKDFLAHVHRIERGLIRVDADEAHLSLACHPAL